MSKEAKDEKGSQAAPAPKEGQVRVFARSDYPAKEAVIAIDAKATVADLKVASGKALDLDAKIVGRYTFIAVAYRANIQELKDDKGVLNELKIKEGHTILLRAPPDIAPRKRRAKKEKEEKKDEKATAVAANRYKGITVNNIWKKLEEKSDAKKQKIILEFFDIYAGKLCKKAQFASLPKDLVITLLKSDTLNAKEVDVFEGALAWGKNECKKLKLDEKKPDDMKKALADILPLIRFPCMSTQDVAVKVTASGLLESDQVLDLFTYLGMKGNNKKAVPGKSIAKMNNKDRKGRRPPSWFKFDANKKHGSLILSADGTVVTSTQSNYQPCFGDVELKEGVWEWEIVLTQYSSQSYACNIGVVPTTYTNYSSSLMIGYSGHVPGWAFACGGAQKYHNQEMTNYGRTCSQGEKVAVRLDLDKKTIEFFINGTSQGIAFRDVTGPVRPAISLYSNQSVTLSFPSAELASQEK